MLYVQIGEHDKKAEFFGHDYVHFHLCAQSFTVEATSEIAPFCRNIKTLQDI